MYIYIYVYATPHQYPPRCVQSMLLCFFEPLSANWQTIKDIMGSVTRKTPAMIM